MAEPHVPADCKLTDSTCEGLAHHIPVVGNRRYNFGQLSSIEAPPLHMGIGRAGGVEQGTGNPTGSMFDYKGPSRRYPEKVTLLSGGRLVDLKVQCPSSELQNLVPRWSRAELQRGFPCSGFTESFLPLRIPACGESSGTETVSSKLRYHDRVCAQACGNCKPWTVPELFWTKTLQHKP